MNRTNIANKANANREQKYDIYVRIFNFTVAVLKFLDKLTKIYSNQVIIGQITRYVTSMVANSEEAEGTNSRKNFGHCFTPVRKEGKETVYWLRLIETLNPKQADEVLPLINEGNQITTIVSTIIKNTTNILKLR